MGWAKHDDRAYRSAPTRRADDSDEVLARDWYESHVVSAECPRHVRAISIEDPVLRGLSEKCPVKHRRLAR